MTKKFEFEFYAQILTAHQHIRDALDKIAEQLEIIAEACEEDD